VYFYPGEIGHFENFREQRTDVIEMRENAAGVFISFATENFVAVNAEPVEKILFLAPGFLDEPREARFDRVEFSRMRFEIRMQTDEVRFHPEKVSLAGENVIIRRDRLEEL